ncbi:MAG: YfiR family protein [Flavobacteriales bacterium]|nr:YfiR family protein [Flavobacteriales bacterium]
MSRKNADKIPDVIEMFDGESTLIVSQCDDCLENGSHFNFVVQENSLKYELNQPAADANGILIGNKLIQFAVNR